MIKKATVSAAAVLLVFSASPAHASELLIDGSFESPVVAAGTAQNANPGLGVLPTNWTVLDASGNVNQGDSNLVHGTATDPSTPLGIDPYDAAGVAQSLDINGNGSAFHLFTAQYSTPVTVKIDFGGRATGSRTTGSYWSIFNNSTNALVASISPITTTPPGSWTTQTSTTAVSLVAGTTYRFVVTLDNLDQVDGITVNQVPEPSTLAAAGIGAALLSWVGIKRRRQA